MNVCNWFNVVKTSNNNPKLKLVLIGNKCDLEGQRVISKEEGQTLASKIGAIFFEISAKDNLGISECSNHIIDEVTKVNFDKAYKNKDRKEDNSEITSNIILVDETGYGKNCICSRFGGKSFREKHIVSMSVDMNKIKVERDGIIYNIKLWDTSGQEQMVKLIQNSIRKPDYVCFIFAINN